MYSARFQSDVPPVERRVMIGANAGHLAFPDDIPNHKGLSGKVMWKLLKARMAMLLGH